MIERKYLAHYLDAAFDMTGEATSYTVLGKDLEEFNEEMNPQVEVKSNILGEQSVQHSGYQVQGEVAPFYFADYNDELSGKIAELVNTRATGDKCKTTMVDVLLKPGATDSTAPTVVWAYREDCYVIPTSIGGDTSGVQVPFTVYMAGNRTKGSFDISTKKFTPETASLSL